MLSNRSSSRSGGNGQDSEAAEARYRVSVTVVLPMPQVSAMACLVCLHDQARRRISRIFRMATRFCGIMSLLSEYEGHNTLLSYLATTNPWSDCQRNRGRFQIGIAVGFTPERWSDSSGICTLRSGAFLRFKVVMSELIKHCINFITRETVLQNLSANSSQGRLAHVIIKTTHKAKILV